MQQYVQLLQAMSLAESPALERLMYASVTDSMFMRVLKALDARFPIERLGKTEKKLLSSALVG